MNKLLFSLALIPLLCTAVFAQNVGIGTSTPLTKLDINGALSARITTKAAAASVLIPDNVTLFRLINTAGGGTTALTLTNPKDGQMLTVINEDDGPVTFNGYSIPAASSANPNVANFVNIGGTAAGWKLSGIQYITDISATNGLTHIGTSDRQVKLGGTLTENTNIALNGYNVDFSGAGNMGVGVASPASKLHIDAGNATASALRLTAGTTTGQTATDGFSVGITTTGNAEIKQSENLPLIFYTNSAERMRLDNAGNLGIGQTAPTQKLEVKNGNILLSNSTGTAGQILLQGTGTGTTVLQAGAQGSTNLTYTLPATQATTSGQALLNNGSGVLSWGDPTSGSSFTSASQDNFEDFLFDGYSGSGSNDNQYAFTKVTAGAGTTSDVDGTVEPAGNDYAGIHVLNTGTTSTGEAGVGAFNLINRMKLGGKQVAYETRVRIETLSTATQTFTASFGLMDADLATATNGVFFTYTNGTNAGNWTCTTRASSTSTTVNSGVAVAANQWYKLKAIVNAAGTQVDFYVDGNLVGSSTTNIPSAACKFMFKIEKSVGATARTCSIDYISWRMVR